MATKIEPLGRRKLICWFALQPYYFPPGAKFLVQITKHEILVQISIAPQAIFLNSKMTRAMCPFEKCVVFDSQCWLKERVSEQSAATMGSFLRTSLLWYRLRTRTIHPMSRSSTGFGLRIIFAVILSSKNILQRPIEKVSSSDLLQMRLWSD